MLHTVLALGDVRLIKAVSPKHAAKGLPAASEGSVLRADRGSRSERCSRQAAPSDDDARWGEESGAAATPSATFSAVPRRSGVSSSSRGGSGLVGGEVARRKGSNSGEAGVGNGSKTTGRSSKRQCSFTGGERERSRSSRDGDYGRGHHSEGSAEDDDWQVCAARQFIAVSSKPYLAGPQFGEWLRHAA